MCVRTSPGHTQKVCVLYLISAKKTHTERENPRLSELWWLCVRTHLKIYIPTQTKIAFGWLIPNPNNIYIHPSLVLPSACTTLTKKKARRRESGALANLTVRPYTKLEVNRNYRCLMEMGGQPVSEGNDALLKDLFIRGVFTRQMPGNESISMPSLSSGGRCLNTPVFVV